jgi:PAS domain S-box-containing protein
MVNGAFASFLGRGQEELTSLDFASLTYPEDVEPSLDRSRRLLSGEIRDARFRTRYLHKEGQALWADVSVSLLRNLEGKPVSFITYVLPLEVPVREPAPR